MGEYGLFEPRYYEAVSAAIQRGDANPLAYLWKNLRDGRYQSGSDEHNPILVCTFQITEGEFSRLLAFIEGYDYSIFSIRHRVCTHFVARAAALVGISLGHEVTLHIPPRALFLGKEVLLWTDPKFSVLTYGSPDVLEKSLREAIRLGIGKDATSWYYEVVRKQNRPQFFGLR